MKEEKIIGFNISLASFYNFVVLAVIVQTHQLILFFSGILYFIAGLHHLTLLYLAIFKLIKRAKIKNIIYSIIAVLVITALNFILISLLY